MKRTRLIDILQMMLPGDVEPGRRRGIVNPRMIRAGMVNDFILNDLKPELMGSCDQLTQLGKVAKVFFDCVKVLGIIAVKTGAGFSIFELDFVQPIVVVIPRRQPESEMEE